MSQGPSNDPHKRPHGGPRSIQAKLLKDWYALAENLESSLLAGKVQVAFEVAEAALNSKSNYTKDSQKLGLLKMVQGLALLGIGETDKGLFTLEDSQVHLFESRKNSYPYWTVLCCLALVHTKRNDLLTAKEFLTEASRGMTVIRNRIGPVPDEPLVRGADAIWHLVSSVRNEFKHKHKVALRNAINAHRLAKETFGEGHVALQVPLLRIATLARYLGRPTLYQQATGTLRNACRGIEGKEHVFIKTSIDLAWCEADRHRYKRAQTILTETLRFARNFFQEDKNLLSTLQIAKAQIKIHKLLYLGERALNKGQILLAQDKYRNAIEKCHAAMQEHGTARFGVGFTSMAHQGLASATPNVYNAKNILVQLVALMEEKARTFPEEIVSALASLASKLRETHDLTEAQRTITKAVCLAEETGALSEKLHLFLVTQQGELFLTLKNGNRALEFFETAKRNIPKREPGLAANNALNIGRAHYLLGHMVTAKRAGKRALTIAREAGNNLLLHQAEAHLFLGDIHAHMFKTPHSIIPPFSDPALSAAENYESARRLMRKARLHSKYPELYGEILNRLSRMSLSLARGEFSLDHKPEGEVHLEKAAAYLKEARILLIAKKKQETVTYADSTYLSGECHAALGKKNLSDKFFTFADKLYGHLAIARLDMHLPNGNGKP